MWHFSVELCRGVGDAAAVIPSEHHVTFFFLIPSFVVATTALDFTQSPPCLTAALWAEQKNLILTPQWERKYNSCICPMIQICFRTEQGFRGPMLHTTTRFDEIQLPVSSWGSRWDKDCDKTGVVRQKLFGISYQLLLSTTAMKAPKSVYTGSGKYQENPQPFAPKSWFFCTHGRDICLAVFPYKGQVLGVEGARREV